jgi:hypothetical protein
MDLKVQPAGMLVACSVGDPEEPRRAPLIGEYAVVAT